MAPFAATASAVAVSMRPAVDVDEFPIGNNGTPRASFDPLESRRGHLPTPPVPAPLALLQAATKKTAVPGDMMVLC
jgi:hypothetical protein